MEKESTCSLKQNKDKERRVQDEQIRERLGRIKNKILVMSGKGGVGKSSIAAFLSLSLAKKGFSVGLMDVDLHGPSIPRLLGLQGTLQPSPQVGKALPIQLLSNLAVVSIEALMGEDKDRATIWRGPLKIGVIRQFIADIDWPDLDYLIIDSPPGTGDEPLTVAQTIPDAKAIIVTTPQEISLADVRKSINFCREVHMQILGLVENMSGLVCPKCGEHIELFKQGGGRLTARRENLKLLGSLPIDPEVVDRGDAGELGRMVLSVHPFNLEFQKFVENLIRLATMPATAWGREEKASKIVSLKKG